MHTKLDNARNPEQFARMQRHNKAGRCHFCPEGFVEHTSPVIHENQFWFVTANDFKYQGAVHHYLIVCKRHVTEADHLSSDEKLEFFSALEWLVSHLRPEGYSLFIRSGDMALTGATLDHLHWHFVVGVPKKSPEHPMIFGPLGYQE